MPRCRFLFACDLGDPISCVHVTEHGCMAGTMLGRVWLFSFESKQVEMLTAFSDEGVRGLYMDGESSYATLNEGCRGWRSSKPHAQVGTVNFRTLDRKNTQSVKHVLQRGPWACVLFPISSTLVNVTRQEHHSCGFKLFDFGSSTEVVPCDFDGETLAIVDRTHVGGPPVFRLVQLETNDITEIDSLPKASSTSLVKLWGPDCLAYVVGSTLHLYDYRKKQVRYSLRGHRSEIVAVDAHDSEIIASLSTDAVVKLWSGTTADCMQTLRVPEASFFLGYPYCLSVQGRKVVVSGDEGVYLLELDVAPTEV
mmetsp:Transcript_48432/g.138424  ORF Transcript_48432/g.138424 Transcript_48432/m.138424 type:complete len:309 (-) Transcript_48432:123-1049(-)